MPVKIECLKKSRALRESRSQDNCTEKTRITIVQARKHWTLERGPDQSYERPEESETALPAA